MQLAEKIRSLKPYRHLLKSNLIGIEKEGLRLSEQGKISQTSHPKAFGCALTHPYITTDFSESLIELITPPLASASQALSFLADTQHYLYHHLPKNQRFWPSSMPCVIRGKTAIPIAQYGKSNLGLMKTVYRQGLANRYGSVMQTIAGIHFNYSFAERFLQKYHILLSPQQQFRQFNDAIYMGLTRNVLRYGWLIPYLFGASAAVCKSFLQGHPQHSLIDFNDNTLYEPFATSLRMGDIGYQNLREDEAGVKANYNSLSHYINSLKAGMQTSCSKYERIGLSVQGDYQQLNTNILQIENEYYASVRPKALMASTEKPLDALNTSGINYIELRSLDINPLLPLGIDEVQIYFLEAFLLFCLLSPSNAISSAEQVEIDNNDQAVAHEGRKPNLTLSHQSKTIEMKIWGEEIIAKILQCAYLLGEQHQTAVKDIGQRIHNPNLTPSARLLADMQTNNYGFFAYTHLLAKQHQKRFLSRKINQQHFAALDAQTTLSCKKQAEIEHSDKIDFAQFLANYFNDET